MPNWELSNPAAASPLRGLSKTARTVLRLSAWDFNFCPWRTEASNSFAVNAWPPTAAAIRGRTDRKSRLASKHCTKADCDDFRRLCLTILDGCTGAVQILFEFLRNTMVTS